MAEYDHNSLNGWTCSCGNDNSAASRFCSFCGKARPAGFDQQAEAGSADRNSRLFRPQSFDVSDRPSGETQPQQAQQFDRPQQFDRQNPQQFDRQQQPVYSQQSRPVRRPVSSQQFEQPATHPSQFQKTTPVPAPQPRKKRSGGRVAAIVIVSLVALIVLFAAAYFTTYQLAKKAADKQNYEQAQKLLFLPDLTRLHDSDLCDYVNAQKAFDTGDYETAKELFEKLGDYKESRQLYRESVYRSAEELRKNGKYDEAKALFETLDSQNYSDSADQVLETVYQKAEAVLKYGEFDEAIALFEDLKDKHYKDADERLNEAVYQKAEDAAEKGKTYTALELFRKLAEANYKDAATRMQDIRYQDAMDLLSQNNYDNALSALIELKNEGYAKADDGIAQVVNTICSITEGGSVDYLDFWKSRYNASGDRRDYEYYVLSMHNLLSQYGREKKTTLYPEQEVPEFTNVEKFYQELKNTSFKDRCNDQCYDLYRMIGEWRCNNFSLTLRKTGNGGYQITSLGNFWPSYGEPAYWDIYDHILSFYRQRDNSKIDDVYRLTFLSDNEMDLYIFKTNSTFRMTK